MSTDLNISGVSERDVDLLLLEEFLSSLAFQEWFVAQALGPDVRLGRLVEAKRSVTDSTGESDLEVAFSDSEGKRARLLIENKVGAGFQREQAARYQRRGDGYVAQGRCATFYAVLVAPKRYFGGADSVKGFGGRVTYEQILAWFQGADELGERRAYKTALLRSAIDKGTLGYQPVEDASVTNFWRSYWTLASERGPELEMSEPIGKPSGATFICFRPPSLTGGVEICHKLTYGYVDLQLPRMGRRLNEVRSVLASHFEDGMALARATGSAAVRIRVPTLDSRRPCSE